MTEPKDLLEKESTPYDIGGPNAKKGMVLTDADLATKEAVQWNGFGFVCKLCGIPAVLHFMKYCGNCGAAVNVQSNKVNRYLEKREERY